MRRERQGRLTCRTCRHSKFIMWPTLFRSEAGARANLTLIGCIVDRSGRGAEKQRRKLLVTPFCVLEYGSGSELENDGKERERVKSGTETQEDG